MKHGFSGIIMAGILLVSMLCSGAAYAQDGELPSPGITPDSPFYFFDKIGKSLGMAFAFGPEAKARKTLQYAEERLSEAHQMASANKTAALERAIADFENYIAQLQARLDAIKQQVASDNISEQAALAMIKHLEVLARVREQAHGKAKDAIDHAENVSMNGQCDVLRHLAKNKPDRAFDICDNITARQMERVRARVSDNVTAANVNRELDYAARIADLEEELAEIGESVGANVTALQQRLAHSTANRLETLSGIYQRAPENALAGLENAIENSVRKYERAVDKLEDKNFIAVSVNETLKVIPEKLRERIQVSANAMIKNRVATEAQERNRERLENKETTRPPVTVTANQTREQKETGKQERNRQ